MTPSPPEVRPLAQRELRIERLEAENRELQEALRLCNGEDIRLNGCACEPGKPCYLHGVIVTKALAASSEEPGQRLRRIDPGERSDEDVEPVA